MDRFPTKKKSVLQILVLIGLVSMNVLKHCNPIISTDQNLNITRCSPKLKLEVPGSPHPCIKHKLQTVYFDLEKCTLICTKSEIEAIFDTSASEIEHEKLFLTFTTQQKCYENDKCRIKCENEEFDRVFNIPSDNSNSIFTSANFWLIFYAWVIGCTAIGGVGTFQGKN